MRALLSGEDGRKATRRLTAIPAWRKSGGVGEAIKKIFNDPRAAAAEMLDGMVAAYNGKARKVGRASIVWNDLRADRPGLLVGGGSGHEPVYHGFIGENMPDAAACGDVFAAPPPDVILEATRAVERGKGVLYLYGNYAGDVLNFDMAAEMAKEEGIETRTVRIWDDVASAPPNQKENRRGIAGLVSIVKLAGAAAANADSLDELESLVARARDATRSVGMALKPGSIPATGKPTFELDDDEIGMGVGVHGEKGIGNIKMVPADNLTAQLLEILFGDDLVLATRDKVVVVINSLGATTMMECLIVLRKAKEILRERGLEIHDVIVGPLVTCQEMAGLSISVTRLDTELQALWDMPCSSLALTRR